jgi:hypothetical protein
VRKALAETHQSACDNQYLICDLVRDILRHAPPPIAEQRFMRANSDFCD